MPLFSYFIFRLPSVQTWVSIKVSEYLSDKLKTEVSIKGVDISIFDHIILEKLYLQDLEKDTLLYVDRFGVNISRISIRKEMVSLNKLHLDSLVCNLKSDASGKMNFQFIIDAFASDEVDTTTSESNWKINCAKILIERSQFSYYMPDTAVVDYGLNTNDLKITGLNLAAKNLFIAGNSIMLDVDSARMKEKCGFVLNDLKSKIFYGEQRIDLNKLIIITDNSKLYFNKLKFSYPNSDAFGDFLNLVNMDIQIADSTVLGLKDAGYFSPELKGFDQKIILEAKLKGTVSDLNVSKFDLRLGNKTHLNTFFKVKGLPDIEKTYFDVRIDTLTTSMSDLKSFKDPANPKKKLVPLPESLDYLGNIYYSGDIVGTISKATIKSNLNTGIGDIISYFLITQNSITKETSVNGNFIGKNLVIGGVIDNKEIGRFDLTDTIDMKLLSDGNLEGYSNGLITNILLYGYNYKSILFNAEIDRNKYKGDIKIEDPNLKLNISGAYADIDSLSKATFSIDLKKFNPYKLNLYSDSLFNTALTLNGSLFGNNPDYMDGGISLDLKHLANSNGKMKSKKLDVEINYDEIDSVNNIKLTSDFFDASISGKLKTTTIANAVQEFIYAFMPSLSDSSSFYHNCNKDSLFTSIENENNIEFDFKLKDLEEAEKLFFAGTQIKEGTYINGKFNALPGKFYLEGYCPEAVVEGIKMEDIFLNGDNRNEKLSFYINAKKIFLDKSNSIDNSLIQTSLKDDSLYVDLLWNSFLDSLNYNGDVSFIVSFKERINESSLINIQLDSSSVGIEKSQWAIKNNDIIIDTNYIDLGNIVAISNKNEEIKISGIVSESNSDTLNLSFKKFDISILNLLMEEYGIELNGYLYGNSKIVNVLGNPRVNSIDSITGLSFNGEEIGRFFIDTKWDTEKSLLSVYADTKVGNTENIKLKGDYFVEKDKMDFKIDVTRFPFVAISPFVQDYLSNITGKISGEVQITGSSKKPEINAGLKFVRAGFNVNDLNTYYSFTDSLFIENSKISFKKMKINAGRNSYAWVSGNISHKDFAEYNMNIYFDAHNFMFLNTKQTDSSYFYGNVYASGGIRIAGPIEDLNIDIKLKTENGTKFYLPLTTSSEASESSFITFTSKDTTKIEEQEDYKVDLGGMNINFDLELTSDAILQIIMDETVGDAIKAQGTGNLNIKVDKAGDIFIYGIYTVVKGDYLFTLQNLVNKKFSVDKGSTIRWEGDPLDAIMNMTAIYKIKKVLLYDLMVDESYREDRTNVECDLKMLGSLSNPEIIFGLTLPDAKEPIPSNINNLTIGDLNTQILSLLILNKFQPLPGFQSSDGGSGGNSAVSNNAMEMLSNQLSNWLSQISDDFDIGVNYKKGDEMTSHELDVAMSTQLFNNRVSINTNVGLGGNTLNQTSEVEQSSANKIVGDVEIEVKLNKNGSLKSKVFNRTNRNSDAGTDENLYTQGVGVFFRKEFTTLGELMRDFWKTITFQKNKNKNKKSKKIENVTKDIEKEDDL
ncbi:MAG: translocation/assembly module TamB domain-containing protein [Bacteroidales bacterium]|nr:translocation/assembly module TamB domain-containing protein [Bacteroidales bacterium]